jgi:radical SAM protein with 4Fe4S-binding SPASM domain
MIRFINIDPNGVCNAKCWFCPVAYLGNSKENKGNMSLETMEDILKQLDIGRSSFVSSDSEIINNPIHFNEVLLYPYFKEMLDLHRKYKIKLVLFTNGLNLTKDKTDIIKKYPDVVMQVLLNIPSIEANQWSNFTGFNIKLFDKLLDNIKYVEKQLAPYYDQGNLYIMVNGVSEKSLSENGGWLNVLSNAPKYDMDEKFGTHAQIVNKMREVFPNLNIISRTNLSDRTNVLSELNIISNQIAIKEKNKGKVISCGFRYPDEHIFISATGNVYLCCADFEYETVYANIKDKSLKEIWESEERQNMIKKSYEGICRTCLRAVWEKGQAPALGHQ